MKSISLLAFLAISAVAQSTNGLTVSTMNLSSTSVLRSILPIGIPPTVEVFINDSTGSDAYSVALAYHDANGTPHTLNIAQLVAFTGSQNTLACFTVDAYAVDSVTVMPLKLTGAIAKQ